MSDTLKNLQSLLHDALLNNSYDYDPMHNTIKRTWMNSFSYLYNLQKSFIEYEELFYYSNDEESRNSKRIGHLYLDKLIYANFDIDYDLIQCYNREEYRLSKFYQTKFTIEDIINNPSIFLKMPVIIIDDKVIWDYKIYVNKDVTKITLPYRRKFVLKDERDPVTDEVIYQDHKIQVLVIDNIFYRRMTLNKSNMHFNVIAKQIQIEKDLVDPKEEINGNIVPIIKTDGVMMCSIHFPNNAGKDYELGTELIPFVDTGDGFYTAKLTDNLVDKMHAHNKDLFVSFVYFNQLYRHKFYTGSLTTTAKDNHEPDIMVIEKDNNVPYKTPIPVENFMVFKNSINNPAEGNVLQKNTDMLNLHYPNIYTWKDEQMQDGDEYIVYYFYHDTYDLEYTVIFDFYFSYLAKIFNHEYTLEKMINDIYFLSDDLTANEKFSSLTEEQQKKFIDVFKKVIDYQYHNYQYGESDFLNRYLKIPENYGKEPIEYKDETLKEWIRIDQWVLNDYVMEQNKLGKSYHLWTNTIDLESRRRRDTSQEFGFPSREFDEDRYVFAFNNDSEFPNLLNLRLFSDGIMVADLYQERKLFMDYLYVPCDLVTKDSYIEIEIFPSYSFSEPVRFTSMDDEHDVTIAEPEEDIWPTKADLYYQDTDEVPLQYDESYFEITSCYDRGEFVCESNDPKKPVKFTRLNHFKIKPKSMDVVDVPLTLNISKIANGLELVVDHPGYLYLKLVENNFRHNLEYIRVFHNGRLIPRTNYRFLSNYNQPRLMILEQCQLGDIIYIDITPYRYKEIYNVENISRTDTLIDLRKILNKPFDIRYYDVYLNGRKLSLNNVFAITPWEISLVNIKSDFSFIIYERERDWEYFGLDYNENIYYFTFDDLINSGFVTKEEKDSLVRDIIDSKKDDRLNIVPNTYDEDHIVIVPDDEQAKAENFLFYYYELLPKLYSNPDRKQFSKDVLSDEYPQTWKRFKRTSSEDSMDDIDRERRKNYIDVIMVDPDKMAITDPDDDRFTVYPIGHLDKVEQELLDSEVIINNDPNIDK